LPKPGAHRPPAAPARAPRLHIVGDHVAQQPGAGGEPARPARRLVLRDHRLQLDAVAAHRRVLRPNAADDPAAGRRIRSRPHRYPDHHIQLGEGSLMEDTAQVHALDYVSVLRRRRWWLVAPIVTSIAVGALLVRVLPKEFKSSTTLGVAAPMVS